ncbi:MAG TPA: hemerythrin domain-containing protein [Drouetiella sp.]
MQSSFKEIVDEIITLHHSLLRRELPKITELFDSMSKECPDKSSLEEPQQLFNKIRNKIEVHLKDEESTLFPIGIALEASKPVPQTDMDLLARLEEMEKEHDGCGKALTTVTQMLDAFPQTELRNQLLETIDMVQQDLQVHVEKENSQVHPRFIQLLQTQKV